jgi:hypothetical protein
LQVISKAEPWIGTNIDGNLRAGSMFMVGATPSEPASAPARSERMSACLLVATIEPGLCGFRTIRVVIALGASDPCGRRNA